MTRFITHDAIGGGIFNSDGMFASGTMTGWEDLLTNSSEILQLVLRRMDSDYSALHSRMRKPWTFKDLDTQNQKLQ